MRLPHRTVTVATVIAAAVPAALLTGCPAGSPGPDVRPTVPDDAGTGGNGA